MTSVSPNAVQMHTLTADLYQSACCLTHAVLTTALNRCIARRALLLFGSASAEPRRWIATLFHAIPVEHSEINRDPERSGQLA